MAARAEMKRYNLVIPEIVYDEVQKVAEKRGMTVVEVLRRFIRLGLIVARVEEAPGAAVVIREGEVEREIVLV